MALGKYSWRALFHGLSQAYQCMFGGKHLGKPKISNFSPFPYSHSFSVYWGQTHIDYIYERATYSCISSLFISVLLWCQDDADLKCDGKEYHTRQILKYPIYSLSYEIEGLQCLSNLFTPFSNEATQIGLRCHNVFIRFRPKHPPGDTSLYFIHRACTVTV